MSEKGGRWLGFLLPTVLLVFFLALRLPALGRFVTTDEALWLRRSANFYVAISNGEWEKTYQSPHPGAITLLAGAAGFWLEFPEYSHIGTEEVHDSRLLQFIQNRGINPMQVLAAGRLVLVLIQAAVFIAAWPFARRLLGIPAAATGMALLALDPFSIAHQRLLHLDGLLASFMLLAVLAYLDYYRDRRWQSLLISGLATGLAWLTKTPSLFLLPAMFAVSVFYWWNKLGEKQKRRLPPWAPLIIWLATAMVIVFILFPALWSDPIGIPAQMVNYALGSAEGEYSGPIFFNGVVYPNGDLGAAGWIFYPLVLLWRSTPLVLVGLGLAIWAWFAKRPNGQDIETEENFPALQWLLVFSIGFIFFMTIAGKKFDRYLLPALPPLILAAGWGWWQFVTRIKWFQRARWQTPVFLCAIAALQLASAAPTYPYYLSYYDPLIGGSARAQEVMMVGWGEGLDQAADYINRQPGVQSGDAAAWYSVSFNLMSSKEVDDIPVALNLSQAQLDGLLAKKYLVIYVHQWQRGTPRNLLEAIDSLEPEKRIVINGIEYVRIYHLE